jgi:putative transposase
MSPNLEATQKKGYKITRRDHFRYRTGYFTDSGVIGSKKFVKEKYQLFKGYLDTKKEKEPVPIKGLEGLFSLKRLVSGLL